MVPKLTEGRYVSTKPRRDVMGAVEEVAEVVGAAEDVVDMVVAVEVAVVAEVATIVVVVVVVVCTIRAEWIPSLCKMLCF
jgi:hypothetical protein